jgi:hypothetical protein
MMLKRIFKKDTDGSLVVSDSGPILDHVQCWHTGVRPEQNFSDRLVKSAIAEGWMTLSKGKLILHCKPQDLEYTINRTPGRYDLGNGKYEVIHQYECVLNTKQHDAFKFQGKPGSLKPNYFTAGV